MQDTEAPSPAVSVLIAAYNVAPYIAQTLNSVLSQDFAGPLEIVVVNDGSPDTPALEDALAPFRDRIVYHVQPNGGPSAARNTALRLSRGTLIALLDGDDLYLPGYLQKQSALLNSDPGLSLVYGDMEVFGGSQFDGRRLSELNGESEPPSLETLIRGTATVLNTAMMRRESLLEAGGWDEASRHSEDYDLWLRIAARGKLRRNSAVLAQYRLHKGSLSSNEVRMAEGRIRAFTKLLADPALPTQLAPLVRRKIEEANGAIALIRGKQAFNERNSRVAAKFLAEAARANPNRKVWLAARFVLYFPRLAYAVVALRARLVPRYRHHER